MIKLLGYGLQHNSWKLEESFSQEVLKEYWNIMACSNRRLMRHDVVDVSVPIQNFEESNEEFPKQLGF